MFTVALIVGFDSAMYALGDRANVLNAGQNLIGFVCFGRFCP
jgi:hypothetical protein